MPLQTERVGRQQVPLFQREPGHLYATPRPHVSLVGVAVMPAPLKQRYRFSKFLRRRFHGADRPGHRTTRTVNDLRRILEENPRYTLEDLWTQYRGTLTRLLKWDPKAFEQVKVFAQKSRSHRRIAEKVVSPHRRDGEFADRLRQAALKLYSSTDRPMKISRYTIGQAAKLAHVVYAHSAYPRCRDVLDEFAETQWHFYARRYLWTVAHLPKGASASEVWKHSRIWYYKFVELDAYFRARSLTQASRLHQGQIVSVLREHGVDVKWEGPCPDKICQIGTCVRQKRHSNARTDARH